MNLLLLEPHDVIDGRATLTDLRRLKHIHETLNLAVGDTLKVGIRNGLKGTAVIESIAPDAITFTQIEVITPPPAKLPLTLVLALPRPIALRRMLMDLVTLGVERLILIQSNRVEKSYWQSQVFGEFDELVRLGLEQAGDTVPPVIEVKKRFRPFIEDELPALIQDKVALVAHPYADIPAPFGLTQPTVLVVGPEGGLVPFEIDLLRAQGVQAVSLGDRILRTETAVPVLIGRLMG